MRELLSLSTLITLAAAAIPATPSALAAQLATPSGVRAPAPRPLAARGSFPDTTQPSSRFPARLGLAVVGGLAGLYLGAVLAAHLEVGVDCDCDDPALGHAVSGAVVGVALGAAILAAVPRDVVACAYPGRLWRGVVGGALGLTLGFLAPTDARTVTVPLGGVVGAALGAESCAWQRHD